MPKKTSKYKAARHSTTKKHKLLENEMQNKIKKPKLALPSKEPLDIDKFADEILETDKEILKILSK